MSWLNRILIIFFVLSLACISEVSATSNEEDLLVKMPHMPSKSIRLGMSVEELKQSKCCLRERWLWHIMRLCWTNLLRVSTKRT